MFDFFVDKIIKNGVLGNAGYGLKRWAGRADAGLMNIQIGVRGCPSGYPGDAHSGDSINLLGTI